MELTGIGKNAVYDALNVLKKEGILSVEQKIDSRKKQFGPRVFRLSTRFISIFVAVSDADPLPESREPESREPESRETKQINESEQINEVEQINKWEREHAPAPAQISSTLNTELPYEKKEVPPPPAAPILPPNWAARPKAHTADELRAELANFYRPYPEQWRATIDGTPAVNWPADKTKDVVENFCAWAIGEGYNGRTFQQINARLKRWFKDEPIMSRQQAPTPANTSTTLPKTMKVYGS